MGKVHAISVFPQPKNRTKKEKVSDGIQYRQIPLFQWFYKYSVFAFFPLYQICNLHFLYINPVYTTLLYIHSVNSGLPFDMFPKP